MLKNMVKIFSRKLLTLFRYAMNFGIKSALILIFRKMLSGNSDLFSIKNVVDEYAFINCSPVGELIKNGDVVNNTINWVVPPWGFGSGGHLNIFRFIHFLEAEGFECRVIVVGDPQPLSSEQASNQIENWFFPLNARVYLGIESAPPAYITLATSWITAYYVKAFQSTVHKGYFVQDFEPYFYPLGAEYIWAEDTYRFGFFGITAGSWLKEKLAQEYGMRTSSFGFSFDKSLYINKNLRNSGERKIFFYSRPPTDRRAFQLGVLVLNEVCKRIPNVKVIFAGWDLSQYRFPFAYMDAGIVKLDSLPDLYSQCDVALVLSFTNLSLLPLELMACGTPVVSNRAPCTEWLLNNKNSVLAEPNINALSDALCLVLNDENICNSLRENGIATASSTDWKSEAGKVALILKSLEFNKS